MNVLVTTIVIVFILINVFSKGKTFQKAPLVSIILVTLVILYYFGGLVWNQIRVEAGPGYLGFIYADESMINDFRAAIGPLIIAICLPYLLSVPLISTKRKILYSTVQKSFVSDIFLNLIIAGTFLICILGEGTSILFRESYLSANGFPVFLRLSGITNLVGIAILASVFFFRSCKIRSWEFVLLLCWFLILIGKGSRSALLPFLIVFVILLRTPISKLFKALLFLTSLVFLTYTTQIIFLSRQRTHGILMLPSNYFLQLDSPIQSGSNFLGAVSILSAGIFTTIVTVPLSIGTLNLQGVLANANPLISNISSFSYDSTSNGIERIFPYSWVPASSAGTLFGVVGSFGIFAIFFLMSTANMFCISKSSWSISGVLFKLAEISFFAQVFFFLEYSTRIWFRAFWAFWLSFALGVLLLAAEQSMNRMYPHQEREVTSNKLDQSSVNES